MIPSQKFVCFFGGGIDAARHRRDVITIVEFFWRARESQLSLATFPPSNDHQTD
jgi:hypothetical protein